MFAGIDTYYQVFALAFLTLKFLWGDRTSLLCELFQTLFRAIAYTERDNALRLKKRSGNVRLYSGSC